MKMLLFATCSICTETICHHRYTFTAVRSFDFGYLCDFCVKRVKQTFVSTSVCSSIRLSSFIKKAVRWEKTSGGRLLCDFMVKGPDRGSALRSARLTHVTNSPPVALWTPPLSWIGVASGGRLMWASLRAQKVETDYVGFSAGEQTIAWVTL